MSKSIYELALEDLKNLDHDMHIAFEELIEHYDYDLIHKALKQAQKQEKLLELYKEFFDKLNIQLRNTFDIDYIYPHEFIIGYGIKSEDKELVKLFKQIKEIENE